MLTKHHERKMPKNLGHIESLARSYTGTAIKTLAGIMMEHTSPPLARLMEAKVLLDRGRAKLEQMHHALEVEKIPQLMVVKLIGHVYGISGQIGVRIQAGQ